MNTNRIATFGEILIRLAPESDTNRAAMYLGGAEANVAVALATWGTDTSYITRMPQHSLSAELAEELAANCVNTSKIQYGGDRVGLYFLTSGADLKSSGVIYDRKYSAFGDLKPGMINWDEVLKDVNWLHWTAISPALNQDVADTCTEMLKVAKQKGITISVDLNYRPKLWQYGKEPIEVMPQLVQYCDVAMGNLWSVEKMLGIQVPLVVTNDTTREEYLEAGEISSAQLIDAFPSVKTVAYTYRFSQGRYNMLYYGGMLSHGEYFTSGIYTADEVPEIIGSGDCFMAGLIYGLSNAYSGQKTLNFATAAAYSKFFVNGDYNTTPSTTIEQLIK